MLEVVGFLLPADRRPVVAVRRCMAMLSTAPVLGEAYVPLAVRALLSVALAFMMLPMTKGADPCRTRSRWPAWWRWWSRP
jgi:flagellar biosynthetic protein FliR